MATFPAKEAINIMLNCFSVKTFFNFFKEHFRSNPRTGVNKKKCFLHVARQVVKHYFMKSLFPGSKQDFALVEVLVGDHLIKGRDPGSI